jgi:hypothetical protein
VINASGTFMFIWKLIKPLIPKKALLKTFVLSKKERDKILEEKIGLDFLEQNLGGNLDNIVLNDEHALKNYFQF